MPVDLFQHGQEDIVTRSIFELENQTSNRNKLVDSNWFVWHLTVKLLCYGKPENKKYFRKKLGQYKSKKFTCMCNVR
jgi:hypothetical protein